MSKIGQSTKTQTHRSQNFIDTYFKGRIIDIGGGGDPLNKEVGLCTAKFSFARPNKKYFFT